MNSFLRDEMLAKEYRRERMAEAKEYNLIFRSSEKNIILNTYQALSKIGALLENMGAKMHTRYNSLVLRKKTELLANTIK